MKSQETAVQMVGRRVLRNDVLRAVQYEFAAGNAIGEASDRSADEKSPVFVLR
jgi:hypothetical protein